MINSSIADLFRSSCFWAALGAWTIAQFTKMLCGYYRTRRLDFRYFVSTGGMPSAHTAMVSALVTAMGLTEGFGSSVFAITLAFALIVMFDASTVRRATGQQARILNQIVDEVFRTHRFSERKLVELLGHTRLEVFMGMIVGVLVGMIVVSLPLIV